MNRDVLDGPAVHPHKLELMCYAFGSGAVRQSKGVVYLCTAPQHSRALYSALEADALQAEAY